MLLQNVKSIFEADDPTIANNEGTFTDSSSREDKTFAFKAPASFAGIYSSSSVEAVNTANNHSHDYGEQSFRIPWTPWMPRELFILAMMRRP
ncbi:MAG: CapA family protein [Ruminococcus sp.]